VADLKWTQAIELPPLAGGRDIGQVGLPVTVAVQLAGDVLVVSTNGTVSVQVTYVDGGQTVRTWVPLGTWACALAGPISAILFTPPAVPFPAVPEVSFWVRPAGC
jgi:hypothetical protein